MGDDPAAKARAVSVDASALMAQLQPLLSKMQQDLQSQLQSQMEAQFAALAVTLQRSSAPTFPTAVSADALARLEQDGTLPDFTRSSIRALSYALTNVQDEQLHALVQTAYSDLVTARQAPPTTGTATGSIARSSSQRSFSSRRQPSPSRFIHQGGLVFYKSNNGRLYDISGPPPRPCRDCNVPHWSWQCPHNQSASTMPHSQNSRAGESKPVYPPPSHH